MKYDIILFRIKVIFQEEKVIMNEINGSVNPAIEIVNLSKKYGSKKVLDSVSFKVYKGEIMGFLGPNGAGKSTTMNIITGYIASSGGRVLVDGLNLVDNPKEVKRKIGYLPEIPPLYMDMTVLEYLFFVYELKGVKGKKNTHLKKIMDKVKIFDVKDRLIRNLSKGYKQRVGLAQALIGDPDILVLDEPTVGLDPKQIFEIRDVISQVGRERTVILSTHIMQEVMAVCDSYTIINKGKIVATGRVDQFSRKDSNSYRLRIKGDADLALNIAKQIDNIIDFSIDGCFEKGTTDLIIVGNRDVDVREDIFNRFSETKMPILLFETSAQTLEELFMQVISDEITDTDLAKAEVDE